MEFRDVLYSRHSTRSFTDRIVTKSEIHTMLDAAIHAPNACNMQSWHYYIITDPAVKEKMAENGVCAPWVTEAPVIFVICTDAEALTSRFGEKGEVFALQDTAAAAENLLLCATDMGQWRWGQELKSVRPLAGHQASWPKHGRCKVAVAGRPKGKFPFC